MKQAVRTFCCAFFLTLLVSATTAGVLTAGYRTRSRMSVSGEQALLQQTGDRQITLSVLDLQLTLTLPDLRPVAALCNRFPGLIPKPVRVMAYLLRE